MSNQKEGMALLLQASQTFLEQLLQNQESPCQEDDDKGMAGWGRGTTTGCCLASGKKECLVVMSHPHQRGVTPGLRGVPVLSYCHVSLLCDPSR